MRQLQIGLFMFGVLSFLGAAFFIGGMMGEILWNTGVAAMLVDVVCIALWPSTKPQQQRLHVPPASAADEK